MKKVAAILLILLLLCMGCLSTTSAQPSKIGQIDQIFDLLHKSKEEAMAMMGVIKDDLIAGQIEKGPRMAGGSYEINREEYENKHLYLRLYYSEENDITGYWIHFYYSADTNLASLQSDYEKMQALVEEKCSVPNEMSWRMTPQGAFVLFQMGQKEQTLLSDNTSTLRIHIWEDPPEIK